MERNNIMNDYTKHLKNKMMLARIFGILACLVAIAGIVLKYLEIINAWLCIISIAYALGTIFGFNSNLQDIKVGNPWQRINGICSLLMYAFVIFLIIYGFATGIMQTQF